jgi:hypothetical protein
MKDMGMDMGHIIYSKWSLLASLSAFCSHAELPTASCLSALSSSSSFALHYFPLTRSMIVNSPPTRSLQK